MSTNHLPRKLDKLKALSPNHFVKLKMNSQHGVVSKSVTAKMVNASFGFPLKPTNSKGPLEKHKPKSDLKKRLGPLR